MATDNVDPSMIDKSGKTARDYAVQSNDLQLVRTLPVTIDNLLSPAMLQMTDQMTNQVTERANHLMDSVTPEELASIRQTGEELQKRMKGKIDLTNPNGKLNLEVDPTAIMSLLANNKDLLPLSMSLFSKLAKRPDQTGN
jgi:hypothetical protein